MRESVRSRRPARPPAALTERLPVARVAVDVPLAHLDRPFDYAVPATMDDSAVAGSRVRVRFSGRLVDGFVLERLAVSDHGPPEKLQRLQRAVSAEPVLSEEVARLARAVADRYAGTLADVLRLAVPPRHAKVEAEPVAAPAEPVEPAEPAEPAEPGESSGSAEPGAGRDREREHLAWAGHAAAVGFHDALAAGAAPRAVWTVPPGTDPVAALATAAAATLAGGRGVLVVAPDARDVDRIASGLVRALGPDRVLTLSADLGPAQRYRRWLAVRRGSVPVVVGTRAAMFAPVRDLGLAVVWDDGDDLHAEPRAPYPHVREVLALRSHLEDCALLLAGPSRSTEAARLLSSGWAHPLVADRAHVRANAPAVRTIGSDADLARDPTARAARLPTVAWEAVRTGLAAGPVLVQVPRRGYAPVLACARCRAPARCASCAGPLGDEGGRTACAWCARPAADWSCPACSGTALRARVVGARRTADELARAFPGVPVRTSGRDGVLASVGPAPALVVATPGAEPVAEGGYAAALLLDGDLLLARPDLRAGEEALRRWTAAALLVRGAPDGVVVVVADPAHPAVQALVRWDPAGFAERELAERAALHLPPAARVAALTGTGPAVEDLLALTHLPGSAEVLGPAVVDPHTSTSRQGRRAVLGDGGTEHDVRTLVRVPVADGAALATALREAAGVRSARKAPDHVQVVIDPLALI